MTARPAEPATPKTVLVVDDQAGKREEIIKTVRRDLGPNTRIITAMSPLGGVLAIERHGGEIDVVVTDLRMPSQLVGETAAGFAVTQASRQRASDVPVMIATSDTTFTAVASAIAAGAHGMALHFNLLDEPGLLTAALVEMTAGRFVTTAEEFVHPRPGRSVPDALHARPLGRDVVSFNTPNVGDEILTGRQMREGPNWVFAPNGIPEDRISAVQDAIKLSLLSQNILKVRMTFDNAYASNKSSGEADAINAAFSAVVESLAEEPLAEQAKAESQSQTARSDALGAPIDIIRTALRFGRWDTFVNLVKGVSTRRVQSIAAFRDARTELSGLHYEEAPGRAARLRGKKLSPTGVTTVDEARGRIDDFVRRFGAVLDPSEDAVRIGDFLRSENMTIADTGIPQRGTVIAADELGGPVGPDR